MFFWVMWTIFALILLIGAALLVYTVLYSEEVDLYRRALDRVKAGSPREAVRLLRRIIENNPGYYRARWQLATLLDSLGQGEKAAEQVEFCLSRNALPDGVSPREALVRLSRIYEKLGRHREAADTWSRYLMQDPASREAYFNRGWAYFQASDYRRALSDFERTIEAFDEYDPRSWLQVARCRSRLDHEQEALEAYDRYLEDEPGDLEAQMEAARAAQSAGEGSRAREGFERVREEAEGERRVEATLRLAELAIERETEYHAEKHLEELEEHSQKGELSGDHQLEYRYVRARYMDQQQRHEEAMERYWSIYEEDPEFRDIDRIIEREIGRMDRETLLEQYLEMGEQRFIRLAEHIVGMMGYDVINSGFLGHDEVNITSHDDGSARTLNRVLFTFKRWDNRVGEWPIKEFELRLLEDRFDRGIFVAPYGFKPAARSFAEDSSIRLIGPDILLEYLREAQKRPL